MIDYFKLQNPSPYTEGKVKQAQFFIKQNVSIRELAKRTAYLKTKIGKKRFEYILDGKSKTVQYVWEDELDSLSELEFVKMIDTRPLFKLKDEKK